MDFSQLQFVFFFLPLALILHKLTPLAGKNIILTVLSLLFFAWGSGVYLLLLVMVILFHYLTALIIAEKKQEGDARGAKRALVTALAADVALLGLFRFYYPLLAQLNSLFGTHFPGTVLAQPMGLTFILLSVLSYLFDIYRGQAELDRSVLNFALYVTFFPKLIYGPAVPYRVMQPQILERRIGPLYFGRGVRLFLIGLAKRMLLAAPLGQSFLSLWAMDPGSLSAATAWLTVLCLGLTLYYGLSGCSDMAIGMAQMFGFTFDKNFDYPYMSSSLTLFWRRWSCSLGDALAEYVYIPLGGNRGGRLRTARNLLLTFLAVALLLGGSKGALMWAGYSCVLLILEKLVFAGLLDRIPAFLKQPFTLLLVMAGWLLLFCPGPRTALSWLGALIGLGDGGALDGTAKYFLSGCWVYLLLGMAGIFSFPAALADKTLHGRTWPVYLSAVWYALLLVLCVAGMNADSGALDVYFRF